MLRNFFSLKHNQPCRLNACVIPDHTVTTLTVQIRSLNSVPTDVVKALIQQKFEVVSIEPAAETVYARN